jgi:hypothetical protein
LLLGWHSCRRTCGTNRATLAENAGNKLSWLKIAMQQIVDRLEQGRFEDLRAALPGVSLVQVIHVTGEKSIDETCTLPSKA